MEFTLRPARPADVDGILLVMQAAQKALLDPEWFVPDDRAYIQSHIDGPGGFCQVAEAENGALAAYFTVKLAGDAPEALGHFLKMPAPALLRTAQMDSCCVLPEYRGNSLERRLLATLEQRLAVGRYEVCLATVHPQNLASLKSFEKQGYAVAATVRCYGGKLRHVLKKQL